MQNCATSGILFVLVFISLFSFDACFCFSFIVSYILFHIKQDAIDVSMSNKTSLYLFCLLEQGLAFVFWFFGGCENACNWHIHTMQSEKEAKDNNVRPHVYFRQIMRFL